MVGKAVALLFVAVVLVACGGGAGTKSTEPPTPTASPGGSEGVAVKEIFQLFLSAEAFGADQPIPSRFTCDGDDISPELRWSDAPGGQQWFALIMDDPDAGGFTHWVIYDVPPGARGLDEGVEMVERPSNGAGGVQGRNDFRGTGYGGPCPPGGLHHYRFQVYAVDALTGLEPGASKQQMLDAITGHILATAALTGTYQRQ